MGYSRSKYGAKKVITIDGEKFDSRDEYIRYGELRMLERAGLIADLQRQVRYELIPAQYIDGKCVERSCSYVADFVYSELKDGKWDVVVEDVKGYATDEYIIKRKLMLYLKGIRIREVKMR